MGIVSQGFGRFRDLTDVPNSYTGSALLFLRVNAAGTGIEFVAGGGGGGGTPGGSNTQVQFNNAGVFGGAASTSIATSGTHLTITAQTATDTPLVLRAATSQTVDLQQWQNSSGTLLATISANGSFNTNNITNLFNNQNTAVLSRNGLQQLQYGNSPYWQQHAFYTNGVLRAQFDQATAGLRVWAPTTTVPGLIVTAAASQTADLQQWQNSAGTNLVDITGAGDLVVGVGAASANTNLTIIQSYNTAQANCLRALGVGSSTATWRGRIVAGGDNVAFLMGEYNSQAWLGGHNAALNTWVPLRINPDGNQDLYLGNRNGGGAGIAPILTLSNATGLATMAFSAQVNARDAVTTGLILRGVAGQTASLLQVQNSVGTPLTVVNHNGWVGIGTSSPRTNLDIFTPAVDSVSTVGTFVVTGVDSYGQTLTLQSPTSSYSGRILTSYKANGAFGQAMLAGVQFSSDAPDYFGVFNGAISPIFAVKISGGVGVGTTSPSAQFQVNINSASTVGQIIRGAASQTADLQQWQNNGGTVLASMTTGGDLVARSGRWNRTATAANISSAGQTIIGVTSTAAARTITLSTADMVSGRIMYIKDESGGAGTNNITVDTQGAELIDGQNSVVITVNYGVLRLYSNGSNWFTL